MSEKWLSLISTLQAKILDKIAPAGFEPASSGPKPDRIGHYPTGLQKCARRDLNPGHWLGRPMSYQTRLRALG